MYTQVFMSGLYTCVYETGCECGFADTPGVHTATQWPLKIYEQARTNVLNKSLGVNVDPQSDYIHSKLHNCRKDT